MIRLVAVLVLTLCSGVLWAQTKVACVGDSIRLGESPVELQRVLGPKYNVRFFVAKPAAIAMGEPNDFEKSNQLLNARQFHPDIVVVRVGNEEDAYKAVRHIDQLEPTLRKMLLGFTNPKSRPRLFLWVGGERRQEPGLINQSVDAYNADVLPLLKQAAREAEATVIEAEIPGSVMPREAAEFLAEAIAPASLKQIGEF